MGAWSRASWSPRGPMPQVRASRRTVPSARREWRSFPVTTHALIMMVPPDMGSIRGGLYAAFIIGMLEAFVGWLFGMSYAAIERRSSGLLPSLEASGRRERSECKADFAAKA